MSVTVRGVYRDGAVVLLDRPPGIREGTVIVTISDEEPVEPVFLRYGKYSQGRLSTLEDFRVAEWRGEGLDDGV